MIQPSLPRLDDKQRWPARYHTLGCRGGYSPPRWLPTRSGGEYPPLHLLLCLFINDHKRASKIRPSLPRRRRLAFRAKVLVMTIVENAGLGSKVAAATEEAPEPGSQSEAKSA